jgi:hypothetical protein
MMTLNKALTGLTVINAGSATGGIRSKLDTILLKISRLSKGEPNTLNKSTPKLESRCSLLYKKRASSMRRLK